MSAANPGYGTGILGSYFINDLGAGMIFKLFRAPFGQKKMPRSSANATMLSPGVSRSSAICQGSRGIIPTHCFAICALSWCHVCTVVVSRSGVGPPYSVHPILVR